jgi:lysine biosynthesis protein LysW
MGAGEVEMSRCPECESDLELDGYELDAGETVHCPECSAELKVVSPDPLVLSVPDEDE